MANGGAGQRGVDEGLANLVDVLNQNLGSGAGVLAIEQARGRDAVEVLAADRDTGNECSKVVAILVHGRLERYNLLVNRGIAARGPQAQKQRRLGADGGRNGRDGVVVSARLHGSVETGTGEAASRGAHQIAGGAEFSRKVALVLCGSGGFEGAVVEALVGGSHGRRKGGGQGHQVRNAGHG